MQEIRWGWVQTIDPTTVRIAGDDQDIPVLAKNADVTVAAEDKVLLAKAGTKDGWVIVCKLNATA